MVCLICYFTKEYSKNNLVISVFLTTIGHSTCINACEMLGGVRVRVKVFRKELYEHPCEIKPKTLNQTHTIAATKCPQTHLKSKPTDNNKIPIFQTHINPFQQP